MKHRLSHITALLLLTVWLLTAVGCQSDPTDPTSDPDASTTSTESVTSTEPDASQPTEIIPAAPSKKGIASSRYGGADADAERLSKLEKLGVSWYYNWGSTLPKTASSLEFIPMVWNHVSYNDTILQNLTQAGKDGRVTTLLTFNEPDLEEQANMSVEQAIACWPDLMDTGLRLSSPVLANPYGNWLSEFMRRCEELDYRVDFIAVHCYQQISNPAMPEVLKSLLVDIYDKYQLPIWLTEYGAIDTTVWYGSDGDPGYTRENAEDYIARTGVILEELGFVERYAWFVDNVQETGSARPEEMMFTALYTDTDILSYTGRVYRDIVSSTALTLPDTLPPITAGEAYAYTVEAAGGEAPYIYDAENLPEGLTIDLATGIISGTPTDTLSEGRTTVFVTDAGGQYTYRYYDMSAR